MLDKRRLCDVGDFICLTRDVCVMRRIICFTGDYDAGDFICLTREV